MIYGVPPAPAPSVAVIFGERNDELAACPVDEDSHLGVVATAEPLDNFTVLFDNPEETVVSLSNLSPGIHCFEVPDSANAEFDGYRVEIGDFRYLRSRVPSHKGFGGMWPLPRAYYIENRGPYEFEDLLEEWAGEQRPEWELSDY